MTNQTLSELLILFLCALSSARVFFIEDTRRDPISVVPLIAFILSLLSIAAFGLSFAELLVSAMALNVFIWNFRALLRLKAQLVIDHYNVLFIIVSILNLILTLLLGIYIVLNCPVKVDFNKKFSVKESTYSYYGNFSSGFKRIDKIFQLNSATVKKYEKKAAAISESDRGWGKCIIFVPNEKTSIRTYEPLFAKLAYDGYTVYAAEFNSPDYTFFGDYRDFRLWRRFFCRKDKISKQTSLKNTSLTYNALSSILKEGMGLKKDSFVFAVADTGYKDSNLTLNSISPDLIFGSFDLTSISDYKSPGWGPVEQSDIIRAKKLGLKRDSSLYTASHLAAAVEQQVELTEKATKAALE